MLVGFKFPDNDIYPGQIGISCSIYLTISKDFKCCKCKSNKMNRLNLFTFNKKVVSGNNYGIISVIGKYLVILQSEMRISGA